MLQIAVAVEQFLVAEGVEQVQAHRVRRVLLLGAAAVRRQAMIGPGDQEILLGERPGVGVVVLGRSFRFGEYDLGRESLEGRFAFGASRAVEQAERTAGDGVVGAGGHHQLRRAGYGPGLALHLGLRGVVAIDKLRVRAVLVAIHRLKKWPLKRSM